MDPNHSPTMMSYSETNSLTSKAKYSPTASNTPTFIYQVPEVNPRAKFVIAEGI